MSFYSADALPRAVSDLEGVLCAGGVMTMFGRGTTARLEFVLGVPAPLPEPPDDEPPDDEHPRAAPGGGAAPPGVPGTPEEVTPARHRGEVGEQGGDESGDEGGSDWDGIDEIWDDDLPVRPDDAGPGSPRDPDEAGVPRVPDETGHAAVPDDRPASTDPAAGDRRPPADPDQGVVVPPDPLLEWRAHALSCAFRSRGVPAEVERMPDGRPVVRSAFRADLVPLARAWTDADGARRPPAHLELDGPRLRLWVLAAGRQRGRAYALGLDPLTPDTHEPLLTACQRAGLGATLSGAEGDRAIVVVGRRRQRRLAELVGHRPRSLADGVWPDLPPRTGTDPATTAAATPAETVAVGS